MAQRLNAADAGFAAAFDAFLAKDRDGGADVSAVVREVIAAVRAPTKPIRRNSTDST